jgi:hypothetical protein
VSAKSIPTIPVRPATVLTAASCAWAADGLADVGDVIACTVSFNQKVRGDTVVTLTYGDPAWSGPASVTVANATVSATFSITAANPSVVVPVGASMSGPGKMVGPQLLVIPTSIREAGQAAQHFVEITQPCCARADLCGLPLGQVSQEPCLP